jgi:hypothetical protein
MDFDSEIAQSIMKYIMTGNENMYQSIEITCVQILKHEFHCVFTKKFSVKETEGEEICQNIRSALINMEISLSVLAIKKILDGTLQHKPHLYPKIKEIFEEIYPDMNSIYGKAMFMIDDHQYENAVIYLKSEGVPFGSLIRLIIKTQNLYPEMYRILLLMKKEKFPELFQ